jgi:predicted O-methyltransferase YrrM
MDQEHWYAVDTYIDALLVEQDDALSGVPASITQAGLPQISVSPSQGKFLMLLAKAIGARSILEIGTLGGFSTIWLARGLPKDGHLITLEIDPKASDVARGNLRQAGVDELVDVRLGSAHDTLAQLIEEGAGPFDVIFIDADKVSYPDYLALSMRLVRPGSLIVADNVVRDGEVIDSGSEDPNIQGVRRFNEMVAADERLDGTILQTVGSKGYDGFAFALVTD